METFFALGYSRASFRFNVALDLEPDAVHLAIGVEARKVEDDGVHRPTQLN